MKVSYDEFIHEKRVEVVRRAATRIDCGKSIVALLEHAHAEVDDLVVEPN